MIAPWLIRHRRARAADTCLAITGLLPASIQPQGRRH
jgi:hypothetical protein